LEAATGVEPVMEVLQSSGGGAQAWLAGRDCAAQSRFPTGDDAWLCSGVLGKSEASRRQHIGSAFIKTFIDNVHRQLGWAPYSACAIRLV
jgi:hypothetical protein